MGVEHGALGRGTVGGDCEDLSGQVTQQGTSPTRSTLARPWWSVGNLAPAVHGSVCWGVLRHPQCPGSCGLVWVSWAANEASASLGLSGVLSKREAVGWDCPAVPLTFWTQPWPPLLKGLQLCLPCLPRVPCWTTQAQGAFLLPFCRESRLVGVWVGTWIAYPQDLAKSPSTQTLKEGRANILGFPVA